MICKTPANMGDAVVLRVARPSDLDVIVSNNRAMAEETENITLPLEVVTRGASAVLQGETSACYYVAEVAGEVAGQLMITTEWSDWRAQNVWWIQSVYVKLQHRKQGLFKRLYAHVREEALKAGGAGLRLYADNRNEAAHAAYTRLGMTGDHYRVFEDMFTEY